MSSGIDRRSAPAPRPVTVEVITYTPTVYYHCQHCELVFHEAGFGHRVQQEEAAQSLPGDLRWDFERLSFWVHSLHERHGGRVKLKLVDAASIEGVWKSLRYGVRRYPAIVVGGREKLVGSDFESARLVVDRYVAAAETVSRDSEGG